MTIGLSLANGNRPRTGLTSINSYSPPRLWGSHFTFVSLMTWTLHGSGFMGKKALVRRYGIQNKVYFAKSTCLMCAMTLWEKLWTRTYPRVLGSGKQHFLRKTRSTMGALFSGGAHMSVRGVEQLVSPLFTHFSGNNCELVFFV